MRMHRVSLGQTNPYLSDPSWLAFAQQNVPFAASQGCVFDYVTNTECCGVGVAQAQQIIQGPQSQITQYAQTCPPANTQPSATPPSAQGPPQVFPPSSTQGNPPVRRLTPQNIARPLPDITAVLEPMQPECSGWQQLNGWINDNPAIAAVGLVAVYFLFRSQQKGRR